MKLGVAVRCFMFMIPGSLCRTLNSRTQNNTFRTYFRNTKTGLFKRMSENEVRCAMHESYFDSSEQRKAMSVSTTLMFIISFLLLVFDSTSFPMLASTIGKTTTAKNTLPLSRFRIEGLQADHLHASHSYISTCFTTCRMSHDASYLSQQSSFCTWLFRLPRSAKRAATQAIIGIIFTFGGVYRLNAASAPIHAADSGIHSPGHIPSSTYNLNGRATGSTTKVANMVLTIVDTATNSPDSIAYDRTAVSTAARMPSVATSSKSTAAAPVIQKKPILGKLGQLFRREVDQSQ